MKRATLRADYNTKFSKFQSTPSVKRATSFSDISKILLKISIHTLCEEDDICIAAHTIRRMLFQSTPSVKRATVPDILCHIFHNPFQSTPSVKRATKVRAC